jgi:hypothetical protein
MGRNQQNRRPFLLALAITLSWLVAGGASVHAQAHDPPGYSEAVDAAQRELDAGDFKEAAAQFERADRWLSTSYTQFGLGRSQFGLRNYAGAIEHLNAALRSQVRPLDGKTRQLAEEQLRLAERSVGRFTIDSNAPAVDVSVDGNPVELPRDRKLLLNVGPRLLEVGASDYESQQLQLIVKGGEDRKLSFALEPSTAWYANPWVWIGAGVLVAGATAAIVVFATTDSDGGEVRAPGRTGP